MAGGVTMAGSVVILTLGAERPRAAQVMGPAIDGPRFEVASVKPHRSADDVMLALQFHEGGRFTSTGTVRMLIRTAYGVQESQLAGGPGWINSDLFDIVARAEDAAATPEGMRLMLRQLLADRFAVRLHTESRDMPIYALGVTRADLALGPRINRATAACERTPCDVRHAPGTLRASGMTMAELAANLSIWVDRLVTDRTALGGTFDLRLQWTPDRLPQPPTQLWTADLPVDAVDPNGPSMFTALQEQLGLRLDAQRGPVDVFVVDRVERPTAD